MKYDFEAFMKFQKVVFHDPLRIIYDEEQHSPNLSVEVVTCVHGVG